jgi:TM2 domain-containing membrane protein YozV
MFREGHSGRERHGMYKIIGADGQQYGPVDADQMRRWLQENRVNAQTLVQPDGALEWKPLSLFPEFTTGGRSAPPPASALPPTIGALSPTTASRASNRIPAGVCGILLGAFGVHKFILGYGVSGGIMLIVTLCCLFGGFLTCGLLWPLYGVMHLIGLIEGIIYLCKSDEEFVRTYVDGRKEWF